MYELKVDKNVAVGKIKPLHGVNNAPDLKGELFKTLTDAGIPYCRLHDSASIYPYGRCVDIPAVFPNFDADENDPNSYDFTFTDVYLKNLVDAGVEPFYRLGVSIENYAYIKAYNIFPPKDFAKWARICEHIILHYNYGWANGFHFGIEYWEIWNEPEDVPDVVDRQMWLGTKEEFFELYRISANYLKEKFPNLKIGGYSSCGFYAIADRIADPSANVSARYDYFITYFIDFLTYISDEKHTAPLDFFSWHSYNGIWCNKIFADYARKKLDEFGFKNTESFLTEWNPSRLYKGTLRDSANIASNILGLQDSPVDMMHYYDLRINTSYCGLYDPIQSPLLPWTNDLPACLLKAYYTFKAFNELYKLKTQVKVTGADDPVFAVAAFDGEKGAIYITNNSEEKAEIALSGLGKAERALYITEDKSLEDGEVSEKFTLNAFESVVIYFR